MGKLPRKASKLVADSHKLGVYILGAKLKLNLCFAVAAKEESLENIVFSRLSDVGGDKRDRTADLLNAIQALWCYKGETLEEPGETLVLPSFAGVVEDYNALCEAGEDAQYGKPSCFLQPVVSGPFYALEFQPSAWVTIGSVRTNDRLQAIDNTGAVIQNLFVTGTDNGSTISAPYCVYESTSLMTAYNAGRLAGMGMTEDIDAE